jgi:hypothetical protein
VAKDGIKSMLEKCFASSTLEQTTGMNSAPEEASESQSKCLNEILKEVIRQVRLNNDFCLQKLD